MKRIIYIIVMAASMAACNNKPAPAVMVDTLAIKQQALMEEQARQQAEQHFNDSVAAIRKAEARAETRAERRSYTTMSEKADLAEPEAAPAKKKGWSAAAKGTLIGAGVGALGGALIDKNHGQGAIIGGVVGAGTGYVVGRAKDRKTGRVVKKPKPE